jgi:hypothetical protein
VRKCKSQRDLHHKNEKGQPGNAKSVVDVGRTLASHAVNDFGATQATQSSYGALGRRHALVALSIDRRPQLIEFAVKDFQPEHKTEDQWFSAMGSGQSLADPYLALMRRSVWEDGQPDVKQATFAAYWVMQQAIAAAPGYIAEPIDIAVLKLVDGELKASELNEEQLQEHKNRAKEANEQLKLALRGMIAPTQSTPPMPELLPA